MFVFDGLICLGWNIFNDEFVMLMGNILEEECWIMIEGFIFDKEVCELCFKWKILILKIIDYIFFFVVKKFLNGEKDE